MCGICGICFTDPRAKVDTSLVEIMNDSLAHRGPDGQGVYVNGQVALGHRRLSIIDLATGDQPIYNEDRSLAIVFNGEIYNYKEIRAELLQRGHQLATESDTEVIVHQYEDFGERCVDAFNGMFAFALWDSRRKRLFAARDRFGEKPFYYYQGQGKFLFASELKAILKDPTVPREVDLEAIDDYLAYGYIPAPKTIFKGIRKLGPGQYLVWENGQLTTHTYWRSRFASEPRREEADYLEELHWLLNDAVRLRLRSDVPVGAFLSGGLDSSGIVALASGQLDRPLQTFSVGFSEADFNELRVARKTAQLYGTDHHEILVKNTDISGFFDLVAHFDEPFGDPSMLPTYAITREASSFVKVCLSGDAGDEVFGGYTSYLEALQAARFDFLPPWFRKSVFGSIASMLPDHVRGKGLLRRLSVSAAPRYQRVVGLFDIDERRELLQPDIARSCAREGELFECYFNQNNRDLLSLCQEADLNTYLSEDILVKVDRTAMKNALEVRVPFLDHRLVDFMNTLPSDLKIKGRTRKYILRKLLANLIPQEVLTGPKRGFGLPIKHWFRSELKSFAHDLLLSPTSRSGQFLQSSAIRRLLENHDRGGRDFSRRIWVLLVLEQWCRCFLV